MNVRELIAEILVEIGAATDAGSVTQQAAGLCRNLINRATLEYNLQDFLHFTKDVLNLDAGLDTYYIESAPAKVASLSIRKGHNNYALRQINMDTFPFYVDTPNDYPTVFVYDRIFNDNKIVGRIKLNKASQYNLAAVVNNNITAYESDNDVICVPPEYVSLIRADVQYRILANRDASDTMKAAKSVELNKIKQYIKELNFAGIDGDVKHCVEELDVIRTGYGRL